MDFIRKRQKEEFRLRAQAHKFAARQARLLLGLTKPKIEPVVIAVQKQDNFPAVKAVKPKKLAKAEFEVRFFKPAVFDYSSFPRWSPKEAWINTTFASGFGFEKALEKRGWKKLGAGAFSSVWARHPDSTKVLKVTRNPDNWIDYIVWAAKSGYLGTFAPMVYSFKRVKGKKHDFFLSIVERMDKTVHAAHRSEDVRLTATLFNTYGHSKNIMAGLFLEEMQPGLAKFTDGLHDRFTRELDLHEGNIMVRANGQLVVTDPVAYGTTKITRLKAKDLTFAGLSIYLKELIIYGKGKVQQFRKLESASSR